MDILGAYIALEIRKKENSEYVGWTCVDDVLRTPRFLLHI